MKKNLFFFGLLSAFPSHASHHCIGKVNTVAIAGNGSVHVNIGSIGDGNVVCNTSAQLGEFTPEA